MSTPSPGWRPPDSKKLTWWELRTLIWPELVAHDNRLTQLEDHMALTDEALTELSSAIDEVAGELDALEAQVGASDADAAAKIRAAADRLRGLRPDAPVEPAPGV